MTPILQNGDVPETTTRPAMTYDVAALRAHFPALAAGAAHFDGPGGSQTPDVVARGGRTTPCSRRWPTAAA